MAEDAWGPDDKRPLRPAGATVPSWDVASSASAGWIRVPSVAPLPAERSPAKADLSLEETAMKAEDLLAFSTMLEARDLRDVIIAAR